MCNIYKNVNDTYLRWYNTLYEAEVSYGIIYDDDDIDDDMEVYSCSYESDSQFFYESDEYY